MIAKGGAPRFKRRAGPCVWPHPHIGIQWSGLEHDLGATPRLSVVPGRSGFRKAGYIDLDQDVTISRTSNLQWAPYC
jgi:hypothetical protein